MLHNIATATVSANWQATSNDFTQAGQIRDNSYTLLHATKGNAEACHDLVKNEKRTVLLSKSTQFLKKTW
jgi:hypothetical protein